MQFELHSDFSPSVDQQKVIDKLSKAKGFWKNFCDGILSKI